MLFREATNIAAKAAASEEVYRVALRCLHTTLEQVEAELKNASVSLPEQVGEVGHAHDVYISQGALEIHSDTGPLLDPLTMKQKGRPRKMYSFLDKQSKKKKIDKTSQSVQISPAVLSDQISSVAQQDDLMSDFHQRNLISPYFLPAGVNHPYCPPPMNDLEFYPLSQRSNVVNMQPSAVVLAGHQLQNLNQVSNVSTVQPSPFVMDGHQLHRFSHVSF
ncbi:hypothetical protein QJS10_CPB15g00084 [Acorus calamus]|uniref:Uncharacterized protein n=1 Tax=Acorus calamus TaxID=4465 RepID=A0AAV9D542_ACOCL|nr:hypothetical protein QJS10_CPB15g00084 [Acorus calamus]